MKRTQLQLSDQAYQLLRQKAFQRGISMAALIREALAEFLEERHSADVQIEDFNFIGAARSEQPESEPVSEFHDKALAEAIDR